MHLYNTLTNASNDFFNFRENRFTQRFQKYFLMRSSLRFHEDFVVCVFITIVICYRFRFIHPIHVADIFECSLDAANDFINKLVKRNYLKLDYLEGIGVGMRIGGHGYYLYSISDSAREEFIKSCPYYNAGIRVRKTVSPKIIHDLIALRMAIIVAKKTCAIDIIPDFSSGLKYEDDDKVPDIFLKTITNKIIWVEMELTTKCGKNLEDFCQRSTESLNKKRSDEIYVFMDRESDAIRYRNYFNAFSTQKSYNPINSVKIFQSKAISYLDAFCGEVSSTENHKPTNYRKGHVPHALEEHFNRRRRGAKRESSHQLSIHDMQYF